MFHSIYFPVVSIYFAINNGISEHDNCGSLRSLFRVQIYFTFSYRRHQRHGANLDDRVSSEVNYRRAYATRRADSGNLYLLSKYKTSE